VENPDPEVRCSGLVLNALFYPSLSKKLRYNHPALSKIPVIIIIIIIIIITIKSKYDHTRPLYAKETKQI